MTDYTKLVEDLHDIEKTMFALGTSPINIDNVSIKLAYNNRWGQKAADAAAAIETLKAEVKDAINEGYNAGYTAGIGYCSFKRTKAKGEVQG